MTIKNSQQESFFFVSENDRAARVKPPFDPKALARLSTEGIFFGTASWKYRGWEGLIYLGGYDSEAQFQRQSLREYTYCFPAVGADFTYYAWPLPDMVAYLKESTPENFRFVFKATKRITMDQFPDAPLYGRWAGKENPEYLNAQLFKDQFLAPLKDIEDRVGAIVFDFPALEKTQYEKLGQFFTELGPGPFALEVRRPQDLHLELYKLLAEHKVTPVLQSTSGFPCILEQQQKYLQVCGGQVSSPLVITGEIQPGRTAEEATKLFHPFDELREPYTIGRNAITKLLLSTRQTRQKTFILIHNRWEGCAPKSVGALVDELGKAN